MKAAELVAWNLRRLRVRRGLSQETLATDADVDRSYVGRLERGEENPTIGVLERIAKHLDADLAEFFKIPAKNEAQPKPLPGGRRPK
jgi:transcriptional regulator with XRE-family HTH domain